MTEMDLIAIRNALVIKGVELSSAASEEYVRYFEGELSIILSKYYKEVYSNFDGFESLDDRSQIILWPLEIILKNRNMIIIFNGMRYYAIGDILIESEFLMVCLDSDASPVRQLYEGTEIAPSFGSFLEKLCSGGFDFIKSSQASV